jgi:hypothetical protein
MNFFYDKRCMSPFNGNPRRPINMFPWSRSQPDSPWSAEPSTTAPCSASATACSGSRPTSLSTSGSFRSPPRSVSRRPGRIPPAILGDSLPEVTAHAEVSGVVDPVSVVARIAFECEIGPQTLLAGVRRILPSEAIDINFRSGRIGITAARPLETHPDPLARLVDLVGSAFRTGADIELTAGFDSRLVLALGLASGALPASVITVGEADNFDVATASAIARHFGIPHRVEPFPRPERLDWPSVRRFWIRAGCAIDPVEYAWVPAVFKPGSGPDRTQLSGVGGEIASGFYAFLGDETALHLAGWRRCIRSRMAKRRHLLASMGSEGERLLELAVARVLARVEHSDTWRRFGMRIYCEERCRSWAGSVLAGSTTLYRAFAPLLTQEYRSLAGSAACAGRGRAWQRDLIGTLEPRLLEFPFRQRWRTARKLYRRWTRTPPVSPRPDPLRHGDPETRDAFELGCLQLGWSPELGRRHAGMAVAVGWLELERARMLGSIDRFEDAPEATRSRTA